jgi:hypothetical protein
MVSLFPRLPHACRITRMGHGPDQCQGATIGAGENGIDDGDVRIKRETIRQVLDILIIAAIVAVMMYFALKG